VCACRLAGSPAARTLVHQLEDWNAKENPIYFGSTPMVMHICRRLNGLQSREILRHGRA
tara:strand:- start:1966 stop:2142 length:177 start_codon:yes stop_codon:yes gene_type:complete